MSELTVDCLSMLTGDEATKPNHPKRRPVTSIVEWAQCFTRYTAIVSQAKPEKTVDLLGNQHLILEAHLEYIGEGWIVYDRRFRQIAATRSATSWAQKDGHMVFSSNQRRPYCQHCFGSTHSSGDCNGATGRGILTHQVSDTAVGGKPTNISRFQKPKRLRLLEPHTVHISELSVHPCMLILL